MPHDRRPQPWRQTLVSVLKVAAIPLWAAGFAVVVWSRMPHAEIPAAFRASFATETNTRSASSDSQASPASSNAQTTAIASKVQTGGAPRGQSYGVSAGKAANASGLRASQPGKTLVSLGDSITFGYGLQGASPNHPSHEAYPFLVASSQMWHVTDLGVPGWTSTDLLQALGTAKFRTALRQANIVTIDIGSNDLLHASYNFLAPNAQLPAKDAVTNSALIQQALTQYATQLPEIIADVRKQTDAPIVLLNLYDPFPDASALHNIGEQMISAANTIIWQVAAQNAIPVVDVHAAFNHNQTIDVRLDSLDIHPTPAGQQLIGQLVNDTVAHPMNYVPAVFATSQSGTLVYSQTAPGPFAIGWLHGNQGLLVTGQQANDWQVVMQNGQTGYVSKKAVTLLLRPFANVQFRSFEANVQSATLSVIADGSTDMVGKTAEGFTYDGQPYVPIRFLASAIGATFTQDDSLHQLNLDTYMHSGLDLQGWDSTGSPAGSAASGSNGTGSGGNTAAATSSATTPVLEYMPSQTTKHANLTESAWMLEIDGEPVNPGAPIVEWNGQLFVPLERVWTSLGGNVTPGKDGLLRLSAAGS